MAFLNPVVPINPIVPGNPVVPVNPIAPIPFLGPLGNNPSGPMPLIGNPLNGRRIVGGPFGGNINVGVGVPTSSGGFVIINNFSSNSVSNFKKLNKADEKFNNIVKDLGNPDCVINKRSGMAIWLTNKYKHILNDTSRRSNCHPNVPPVNPALPPGRNFGAFLSTTVIVTDINRTLNLMNQLRHPCIMFNGLTGELTVTSNSVSRNLALLLMVFDTQTPGNRATQVQVRNWNSSLDENSRRIKTSGIENNFEDLQ